MGVRPGLHDTRETNKPVALGALLNEVPGRVEPALGCPHEAADRGSESEWSRGECRVTCSVVFEPGCPDVPPSAQQNYSCITSIAF